MKKIFFLILVVAIALGYFWYSKKPTEKLEPVGGYSFFSATNATSSVGRYAWTRIATTTPNVGFYRVCDSALSGVNVNNPVYLAFVTTTTLPSIPYGTLLESGKCYSMSESDDNLFYGWIYAWASTSTTTLTQVYK